MLLPAHAQLRFQISARVNAGACISDRYRRLINHMAVSEDEVASWKFEETVEWALKQYNSRVAHRFEGT